MVESACCDGYGCCVATVATYLVHDMERIWHHILYNEFRVTLVGYPVFTHESTSYPEANRERMTQNG